MSWSPSLIKSTLEEFKDEIQEMTNLSTNVNFKALLDYHEEVLEDSDYGPFFITGESLPVKLGDKIKIKSLEATATSWDYRDDTFQIVNIHFTPLFKEGDIITDLSQEAFKIKEVTTNFYRLTKMDESESLIFPLVYQDVIKKVK